MTAARTARALLVIVLALLLCTSRSAPHAAANSLARAGVAEGASYVPVMPPSSQRACMRRVLPGCFPGDGDQGAHLATTRVLVGAAQLPASSSAAIVPASCPDQGAVCGTVPVPLDRAHPADGTIRIFFELFTHTAPGPAQSAILVNPGGPGFGTVASSPWILYFFGQNLDVHDLLLIDDRGRGLSGTIDCAPLQHGTEPFAAAEADCAAQLGRAASRYGTGDIAQDTEAVRAALGYDKVDYVGFSAGGQDVAAYATRFGSHLRSIVLDAPYGPPGLDPLLFQRDRTLADSRMIRLICTYSPTCSAVQRLPEVMLALLVHYIRHHPIEGDAYDANGNLVHVRIDETYLLWYIIHSPTGFFTSTGELPAAAVALFRGDPAPLLRLGAEGFFPWPGGESGDPTNFSSAAHYATGCVDALEPWDWAASVSERQVQYDAAVRQLPLNYFAPFSKTAATSLLYSTTGEQCLWWQKPAPSSPVTPLNPTYPSVPTLVLAGNVDDQVPLEEAAEVAHLYPGSTLVTVAGSFHTTLFHSICALNLATHLLETLQIGDTSCARTPETVARAVGRFPLVAGEAVPAAINPGGNNQIRERERRVVTVVVAAATDALERMIIGSGDGRCLRAGRFHTDFPAPFVQKLTLSACAFSQDVAVSGTEVWGADGTITADFTVSGTGTAGGVLHVAGSFLAPGPVGSFTVSGQLGGLTVGALVPEA